MESVLAPEPTAVAFSKGIHEPVAHVVAGRFVFRPRITQTHDKPYSPPDHITYPPVLSDFEPQRHRERREALCVLCVSVVQ